MNTKGFDIFYLTMAIVALGFILMLLPTLIERAIERANRKKNKS